MTANLVLLAALRHRLSPWRGQSPRRPPHAWSVIFPRVWISCPGHRGSVGSASGPPTCLMALGLSSGSATSQPTLTCLLQGPPQPNLPPGRASPSLPCPLQLDPAWHPPSAPQGHRTPSLCPPPPTRGSLALVCLPVLPLRCSLHMHLNPLILTAPGALWAERAAAPGSRLSRLVTLAPDSAHSSHPMHCSLGVAWGHLLGSLHLFEEQARTGLI